MRGSNISLIQLHAKGPFIAGMLLTSRTPQRSSTRPQRLVLFRVRTQPSGISPSGYRQTFGLLIDRRSGLFNDADM